MKRKRSGCVVLAGAIIGVILGLLLITVSQRQITYILYDGNLTLVTSRAGEERTYTFTTTEEKRTYLQYLEMVYNVVYKER